MKIKFLFVALLATNLLGKPVSSADRFFVLSGGNSPSHNHYSQYLQTKTLADWLKKRFGKKRVDVLFGAGNSPNNPKILPDVHAKFERDGGFLHQVFYGVIEDNRPATRTETISALRDAVQSTPKDDTFFLFVSDHGMPNQDADDYENNCINLWNYNPKDESEAKWRDVCLSREDLQPLLQRDGKGKTVFAMSQCYSGSFHRMSVTRDDGYPVANSNICGFTSVPEDMMASGCTDDVQADRYQGYERSFTEMLTGRNVVTGKLILGAPQPTVKRTHEAAVLRDMTLDVPLSTSDIYLEEWYYLFYEEDFCPRTGNLSADKIRSLADDVVSLRLSHNEIIHHAKALGVLASERLAQLDVAVVALSHHNPKIASLLAAGEESKLEGRVATIDHEMDTLDEAMTKLYHLARKTYYREFFKPWHKALKRGDASGLNAEEKSDFEEKYFSYLEQEFKTDSDAEPAIESHLILALSELISKNPSQAKRFAAYWREREMKITNWIHSRGKEKSKRLLTKFSEWNVEIENKNAAYDALFAERSHVLRILRARRQIAALTVLGATEDNAAVNDVTGLAKCEGTALFQTVKDGVMMSP